MRSGLVTAGRHPVEIICCQQADRVAAGLAREQFHLFMTSCSPPSGRSMRPARID